jgi:ATP-dependent Lon protease
MSEAAQAHPPLPQSPERPRLPEDIVPILPVRGFAAFPGAIAPLTIGRPGSVAAAQAAAREVRALGILMQRDPQTSDPRGEQLHEIGVLANVLRYVADPQGAHHLICQGEMRFRVVAFVEGYPFLAARIERLPDETAQTTEIEARFENLKHQALELLTLLPEAPAEIIAEVQAETSPSRLTDITAAYLDAPPAEKQTILETLDLAERMDMVLKLTAHRIEVLRLSLEIGAQTKAALDERQREIVLREQLAAIQRELGEGEGAKLDIATLAEAIGKAGMPQEVEAAARKELRRLERTPEAAAEYSMIRTYLDWMCELPWRLEEALPIDLAEARAILDEDHYGLKKVKERIVEYLAVRKLAPQGRAPILCFVGPPGVGKTSLGQSIARAMGRKFVRVSLGGVHDEAEIRGHRRTYVGAMPGNIVQAIRKAGARDCVMMLDELDKMGVGIHGDPAAAMLEVLDPEQNVNFRDNYLAVPFDLSAVVFIATANMMETLSAPLRDRVEIIGLSGYTESEKFEIARRYLVARQLEANGLTDAQVMFEDAALRAIIRSYTREAGVRGLEREIGKALRRVAVTVAEKGEAALRIGAGELAGLLGPPRFESEVAMRTSVPGVATGLAWTPVGGDILFVEAARMPGKGVLTLTGQLGDVMRESAQAALSLVKSSAASLSIDAALFDKSDIHIHVPAGATPKDGPSAGVAIYVALVSLLTGRPVRSDTAMTGEISLRGLVLPVGGIKEKVTAAARAGLKRVMLPARNRRDFDDIPEEARLGLDFIWLDRAEDAANAALDAQPGAEETKLAAAV